ncbi:hypothetical protein M405DRAFT_831080 [Rhizopogon salebrosus TDB-379]|nr:hypothetical protein M405DRAFT_831080 [Rhizopogon salebrosus TDB-379]
MAVRAPIQRMRAATEIPARQSIACAVRALRCALAESNRRSPEYRGFGFYERNSSAKPLIFALGQPHSTGII